MLIAKRPPGTERLCIKTALSRLLLISVDVRSTHRFLFSIDADRLGVKNGVLAGSCIKFEIRQGKIFVIWWVVP